MLGLLGGFLIGPVLEPRFGTGGGGLDSIGLTGFGTLAAFALLTACLNLFYGFDLPRGPGAHVGLK
ncbi:hypothetical protein QQM39_04060 [Streptomyces sp. DT2A-34]|uniref:hypothetical protein n=1 Tax=Streptomyces sp. DT2A-34 TaxID=3051182 RepID=UPI00265BC620|nr:hypothetical protein [Streptomyces sp. DT2A-34]MDO0910063.1 hypothetical protein [Streptomyces sp. DT2A-34]